MTLHSLPGRSVWGKFNHFSGFSHAFYLQEMPYILCESQTTCPSCWREETSFCQSCCVEAMESGVDSEEDALERVPRDVVPPVAGGEDILSEDEAAGEMVCTKGVEVVSSGVCPLHGWFVAWIEVGASPSCCKWAWCQMLEVIFVQGRSEVLCFLCCAFSLHP